MTISKSKAANRGGALLALMLLNLLFGFRIAAGSSSAPAPDDKSRNGGLQVAVGTVLPVRLSHGFSTKTAKAGDRIEGRIMQDVPLPNAAKIPKGAKLKGAILSVSPAGTGSGERISLRFDHIQANHYSIPIVTDLRAMASFMEVEFAQIPETSPGFGTPYVWVTTDLIGGGVKYGVGGPVTDHWSQTVGKGVYDGVLVRVHAQPGTECRGPLNEEAPLQALWVFSADACGLYGMPGVFIVHAGRTEPLGQIVIASLAGDLKVAAGAGMLLRVIQ